MNILELLVSALVFSVLAVLMVMMGFVFALIVVADYVIPLVLKGYEKLKRQIRRIS